MEVVLAVGGVDPIGASGLSADIRAGEALGVHIAPVASALTVQSMAAASRALGVPLELFADSLAGVLASLSPRAVKTGLVPSTEHARSIVRALPEGVPLVVDPVLAASGGGAFVPEDDVRDVVRTLAARATLLTPNAVEASRLTSIDVRTPGDAERAARTLLDFGAEAVLVKGGHFDEARGVDVLVSREGAKHFAAEPWTVTGTRGTGCTLATAVAASLARGLPLTDAISRARHFVATSAHMAPFVAERRPVRASKPALGRLHFLTGDRTLALAALRGGASTIQFREKRPLDTRSLVATAQELRTMTRDFGATLLVNDRVDVAEESDADGVHLGASDLLPSTARAILGPSKLVGATVNDLSQLAALTRAHAPVDYLGVGPVFGTLSKENPAPTLGLEGFAAIAKTSPWPVVGIGSIDASNAYNVHTCGAHGVAVIAAIAKAESPEEATRALVRAAHGEPHA